VTGVREQAVLERKEEEARKAEVAMGGMVIDDKDNG
jgi:hypothetical protein